MITQIQQNLEDMFYEKLVAADVGKRLMAYLGPSLLSVEEMADAMTQGYNGSSPGELAWLLGETLPKEIIDFRATCKAAFRDAILRILRDEIEGAAKK